MSKIGLLFGSFNPPHLGHLHLASAIQTKQKLDEVWFILQLHNPYKPNQIQVTDEQRVDMLRLSLVDHKTFSLHVSRAKNLPAVITALQKAKPSAEFSLIIGKDLADTFANWEDYPKLQQLPVYSSGRFSGISSEQVRDAVKSGDFPSLALPPAVAHYIKQQNLYK